MSPSLVWLIGSAVALFVVAAVFRVEDARGGRLLIAGSLRRAIDHLLSRFVAWLHARHLYPGRGLVRIVFHYLVHTVLQRLLATMRWSEAQVERLIRRNRSVAKKIDLEKRETQNHLDAIAAYKAETALTEKQKQRLRAHH